MGLACHRGGRRLFSGLDLRLQRGQAIWLRGPNGCGKTSLLRIIAGLSRPEGGELRFAADVRATGPAYIGHSNALKDELSAQEALGFLCALRGPLPSRQRVKDALARFDMATSIDAPVRRLSQGQRRKLCLARLWLDDTRLWLLDEPYDALDEAGAAALDQALQAQLDRGSAVLMTSHQAVSLIGVQSHHLAAGCTA